MKLYTNGDSHTAAAEAVNPHAFAEDDTNYFYLGRAPHPANWQHGWSKRLAETLQATLHTDAESASSNARIMRTTRDWITANQKWLPETVMVIQWSTWERVEKEIDGKMYQLTASGQDHVPEHFRDQYRLWISNLDWSQCMQEWHSKIYELHLELTEMSVAHIFFNGNNDFAQLDVTLKKPWDHCFIGAYDSDYTFNSWLRRHGFDTVSPDSWHFGPDAHAAWANFVLQYGIKHNIWR